MNLEKVLAREFPETSATYNFKDTILYALGTGFGSEPLDAKHLKFLYEDGLVAVPTFANVLGHPGFWVRGEEYEIDWRKLLHAEHRLTLLGVLPPEGEMVAKHDIIGIRDKGVGAGCMMHQRKSLVDAATGETLASVVTTLMMRGDGGCGDWGEAPAELEKLPETAPDSVFELQTTEIQPLIYRLSGDLNPLHIDPSVATHAGFERPILHGLGTMGLACYMILKNFTDFDTSKFKSLALRFSRPVLPGDLIKFEFWKTSPGVLRFRAAVPARGLVVLDRGTAEIG
jgi:acyl dehydratase